MNKKILIVDDDPQVRKILSRMLAESDYEVFSAENGFVALDMCKNIRPDLVILDIMMPGISGIEVCEKLRQAFNDEVQILMISAKDSQADRRLGLEYGGNDYITKPFHLSSLLRKINYMLGQPIEQGLRPQSVSHGE